MTVYGRNPSTGQFTEVIVSDVACRLVVRDRGAHAVGDRREPAALHALMWDAAVAVAEDARIEVAGLKGADGTTPARWTVERGSLAVMRGPGRATLHRCCNVVRVESVSEQDRKRRAGPAPAEKGA
jgi:hypothetical protein